MADRVHPRDSPPPSAAAANSSDQHKAPAGTYVIQVPKDQIYRYPPPSNPRRYNSLSNPKPRRGCCCRFLCCAISSLLLLIILAAAASGVFYLVVRPELPKYSVDRISISGFNFSSPSAISPAINVSVRANNPNDKIKIHYRSGSAVSVLYAGVDLCDGKLPAFRQPSNNVTVFPVALKASSPSRLALTGSLKTALVRQQKEAKVPLTLKLRVPVKIQVGAVKTWEITVKVSCDLTVNSLTASSKIVSKDCGVRVKLW